jgi:drug/metabolite transporter (DMT)-like permease
MFTNWIFLAFFSAIVSSVTNILIKKASKNLDEYIIAWSIYFFALPILWGAVFLTGLPKLDTTFWWTILFLIPFEIAIAIVLTRAAKISPISLIAPLGSFTNVFIAIVAYFLLSEKLSVLHIVAIFLSVVGTYILRLEKATAHDFLAPFRALLKEKGPLYAIIGGMLIGVTVPVGKIAVQHSSPEFFSAVYFSLFTLFFIPILIKKSEIGFKGIIPNITKLAPLGIAKSIFFLAVWSAFKFGPVALAEVIVSTSSFFTIIFAGTFLHEKGIIQKLIAASVMFVGTLLIIFNQ